ncbi:MAG: BON domain-containing protein [Candidatus Nitrotoga sp.]
MRTRITTVCFVIGLLLIPIRGFAVDSKMDLPDPTTIVKDSDITNKIKVRLNSDKHLGKFKSIKVETDNNGVVWLSGTAHLLSEEEKAVEIARSTEGVVIVRSNIEIKNGHAISD